MNPRMSQTIHRNTDAHSSKGTNNSCKENTLRSSTRKLTKIDNLDNLLAETLEESNPCELYENSNHRYKESLSISKQSNYEDNKNYKKITEGNSETNTKIHTEDNKVNIEKKKYRRSITKNILKPENNEETITNINKKINTKPNTIIETTKLYNVTSMPEQDENMHSKNIDKSSTSSYKKMYIETGIKINSDIKTEYNENNGIKKINEITKTIENDKRSINSSEFETLINALIEATESSQPEVFILII